MRGSAHGVDETEVGVKTAWLTGAKLKYQSHFQALPLHIIYREHHSRNQSVVDWVTSHIKMFSHRKPQQ